MDLEVLVFVFTPWLTISWAAHSNPGRHSDSSRNLTHPNKDMYVLLATVYELGILSNKTDNRTGNINSTGNQESVTLYRSNGTSVNLSAIPEPFLTNVTTRTLIGVAPVPHSNEIVNVPLVGDQKQTTKKTEKRSLNSFRSVFKRDSTRNTPLVNGGPVTSPDNLDVKSILPFLVSLNNNMTKIPATKPTQFSVIH